MTWGLSGGGAFSAERGPGTVLDRPRPQDVPAAEKDALERDDSIRVIPVRLGVNSLFASLDSMEESTLEGRTLGFHGGLALDYRLTERIGLYLEGGYQHADVSPLKGRRDWNIDWEVIQPVMPLRWDESYHGDVTASSYEWQWWTGDQWRPTVELSNERPEERPQPTEEARGQRGFEELHLDLSGASVHFGASFSF